MTTPIPQISIFMVLIVGVGVFCTVGVYCTFVKPAKKWHRWAGFAFVTALAMLPALTGWGPLQ